MRTSRLLLTVTGLALAATMLPAAAIDLLPDGCTGRAGIFTIEEDEELVEQTVYFTSPGRIGDLDAADSEWSMATSEDEPEGDESKVYVSRPGSLGNPAVQRNSVHGFFIHEFEQPTRVVCARVDVHVSSPNGSLPIQFYVDTEEFLMIATGAPGHGTVYSGAARRPDGVAWDVTVQFNPGAPGAAILYDSADHPSSLTIVTVQEVQP
jgi:hypothetical protein